LLILDRDRYRYQIYCSDLAGQDIREHRNDSDRALKAVRNWLQASPPSSRRPPGAQSLISRYLLFRRQLRFMCEQKDLTPSELTFLDYRWLVEGWIEVNSR